MSFVLAAVLQDVLMIQPVIMIPQQLLMMAAVPSLDAQMQLHVTMLQMQDVMMVAAITQRVLDAPTP